MAIAHVVSAAPAGGTNGGTTSAVDTTGANLIVGSYNYYVAGPSTTFTDSKGNTWTVITGPSGVFIVTNFAYCYNPTVGSGHTFTSTGVDSFSTIAAVAVSGAASSPWDETGGSANSSGVTSLACGSTIPRENSSLIYSVGGYGATGTYSVDSGMTDAGTLNYSSGVNFGHGHAYKIQTTYAAIDPTWSTTGSATEIGASVVCFRAAREASAIPYTTDLTGQYDASAALPDTLWQNWQSSSPYHNTPVIANNDPVDYWDDEQGAASAFTGSAGTTRPLWKTSGINGLPAIQFDGTNDFLPLYNDQGSSTQNLSTIISASACTLFVSFRVTADASNETAPYDNDGIISDAAGYFGLFLKTNAGVTSVIVYNYDGNEDTVSINISQNTDYVAMVRHESGTLYLSINGGAESSVVSGNTSSLSGAVVIGRSGFKNTNFAPVIIGEIATYSAALTGTNLTSVYDYFTDKWLPTAGGSVGAGLISGLKFNRIRLVS